MQSQLLPVKILFRIFSTPPEPRSTRGIIAWWELRRILYNALMLVVGVVSLIVFFVAIDAAGLPPGEDAIEPMLLIVGVPFIAIAANVCYTLGWLVELAVRATGYKSRSLAPELFAIGTAFSIFVLSLPAALWTFIWILTLFGLKPFGFEDTR